MNVEQLVLHLSYVEVMRKGEASRSKLSCPFSSSDGKPMFCGPWCPHFGDYREAGTSILDPYPKGSRVIKLTCGQGTESVCQDHTQFADFRYADELSQKGKLRTNL